MAITNYAVKYSGAVDEKFAAESKSDLCVNIYRDWETY